MTFGLRCLFRKANVRKHKFEARKNEEKNCEECEEKTKF